MLVVVLGAFESIGTKTTRAHDQAIAGLEACERLVFLASRLTILDDDFTNPYDLPGHPPQEARATFNHLKARFGLGVAQLKQRVVTPAERTSVDDLERAYGSYVQLTDRIQALSSRGSFDAARRLYYQKDADAADHLSRALRSLMRSFRAQRVASTRMMQEELRRMEGLAILGGLLSLLLGVMVALNLARAISRPVLELEQASKRLATGASPEPPSREADAILELRSLRATLEESARQVARKADLEAAVRELQALSKLKNQFVSSVSHELRTPLSSIVGYSEFLEEEIGGNLSDEQKVFVREIREGAGRLARLVDDLLDFARLEGLSFSLSCQPDDLNRVLGEVVSSLEPQAHQAGVSLQLEAAKELPIFAFDRRRIGQVAINLVGNALKFTPRGGKVVVSVSRDEHAARIVVRDTGIGIAPGDLPKLFQKFYQVDPSNTRERGGVGLGLSISKALVEAHGGQIGVLSQPGVGTTFWFSLPLARAATSVGAPALPGVENWDAPSP